ncbi:MAG: primosomal protein N' [Fibrobacteria bacterium]|nr:primosomal protein N' [Fibrobacteria bacterium]
MKRKIELKPSLKVKVLFPGNLPEPFWYEEGAYAGIGNNAELAIGYFVKAPLKSKITVGLIVELQTIDLPYKTKKIQEILPGIRISKEWIEMCFWLEKYYHTPVSKVFATAFPKFVFKQLDKILIGETKENLMSDSLPVGISKESSLVLNQEQQKALDRIKPCFSASESSFKSFLLHGITGSGKTLVYLHLVKHCLAMGKNALVLLPEIALTPQIVDSFEGFLDESIFVFHSNLNTGQKRRVWNGIFTNKIRILIGVRSAILPPLSNLGLIVVDEEHDGSYKQSEGPPRYNARDVALFRGQQLKIPVVLGSATPSLETYYRAVSGKHTLIELTSRATKSSLPDIHVVDMREQYELQGRSPISIPLRDALTACLARDEQAILLLNRRGYAKRKVCKTCGEILQCPNCFVPLVPHKSKQALVCHYCGFTSKTVSACHKCKGREFVDIGLAIEKLEEYLNQIFPTTKILRMDSDSTSKIGSVQSILESFRKEEANILIGTQMVAKGHDFVRVNLVGILDADTGLGVPDFRARERAYQLVTQVAGRAGRHSDAGTVFIQSFDPENPALQAALGYKYSDFYSEELSKRKELDYPPFRRLFKIEISGSNESLVVQQINQLAVILREYAKRADIILLGPGFAVLKKLKRQYRCQIFGRGNSAGRIQWALNQSLEVFKPQRKSTVRITIDMDPVSVM